MNERTIEVQKREKTGKGANRQLRAEGFVPAVLYGGDKESVAIQLPRRELLDHVRATGGLNAVFLLQLTGSKSKRHAMIRDMQVDAVTREILHIDFLRVLMTEKVRITVSIELEGTPSGVKNEGGVLDFVSREVEVECLPSNIPNHLTLDVSALEVGDHLEAGDLQLPEDVELLTPPSHVIAAVAHGRLAVAVEEEEAEEEALIEAEPEEPEVIGRGKDEEEEGEES